MVKAHSISVLKQVVGHLEKLIGASVGKVEFEPKTVKTGGYIPDVIAEIGGFRFVIEFKSSPLIAPLADSIEQLKRYPTKPSEVRLLATPFMGNTGMRKCAEAGLSWLDLSGNADVKGPGLRLYARGEKNKFKSPGRKENPFAPKSSRIARHLLYQPRRLFTQKELADETGLGEGFVSRIVKSFLEQQIVIRDAGGKVQIRNSSVMLDAWQQGYDFTKHEIIRGHVPGRSGDDVQAKISRSLKSSSIEHAATGLGASWLYVKFAAFRTASFYLRELPQEGLLSQIGFRKEIAGANVWLIIPKDPDVFFSAESISDIPVVHRIQVWLDLNFHPERAEEAAVELKKTLEIS